MTTALCKMICVLRNKWGIEMTNGAAEMQNAAGLQELFNREVPLSGSMEGVCVLVNINNFLLGLSFLIN